MCVVIMKQLDLVKINRCAPYLVDEYGIDNVAAVIIRNDNPNLGKVLAEFGETIEMFSHKPSIG